MAHGLLFENLTFILHTILLLALINQCWAVSAPACFSCSYISHARYCDFYTQCAEGEVCYVKKVEVRNGHYQYTSGCMSNQTCGMLDVQPRSAIGSTSHGSDVCIECCHGEMCNNKGCGDNGPPERENRGPYCFQCDHLSDPGECDQLTICDSNEVCGVEESFGIEPQFATGCKRKAECIGSVIFGRDLHEKERALNLCRSCCDTDFCNDICGETPAWSEWGDWSNCSVSCGRGTQNRSRTCSNNQDNHRCEGHSTEERNCTGSNCVLASNVSDCNTLYKNGYHTSDVYSIRPDDISTFDVYCDMEHGDGGWIVLQHRFNGTEVFNRPFANFENGFGSLNGEFWLGLKKIYILAHSSRKVRFNLQALNGTWLVLEYGNFSITDASQQYTMYVSNHITGFADQTFAHASGEKFYTYDKGNVCSSSSLCTGWWYPNDGTYPYIYFNINGKFEYRQNYYGVYASLGNGNLIDLRETYMMIQ